MEITAQRIEEELTNNEELFDLLQNTITNIAEDIGVVCINKGCDVFLTKDKGIVIELSNRQNIILTIQVQ